MVAALLIDCVKKRSSTTLTEASASESRSVRRVIITYYTISIELS